MGVAKSSIVGWMVSFALAAPVVAQDGVPPALSMTAPTNEAAPLAQPLQISEITDAWIRATGWVASTTLPSDPTTSAHAAPGHWDIQAEFLLSWIRDNRVPVLLTVGSPKDDVPGALGMPGTQGLFGGSVNSGSFPGGRLTVDYAFDGAMDLAAEGRFFFLGRRSVDYSARSSGATNSLLLARPFFNVPAGAEDADFVSSPGEQGGAVAIGLSTRLFGAEANLRQSLWRTSFSRFDLLGGFRFAELDDTLDVAENLIVLPELGGGGATVADHCATHNRFFGGQVGGHGIVWRGPWFIDVLGTIAFGVTRQTADIGGFTQIFSVSGTSSSFAKGLLALPTNSGHFTRERFAVLPEAGLKLGYQLTDHLQIAAGYSVLVLSQVARPGQVIDRGINPSQLPSISGPGFVTAPFRPTLPSDSTWFWAQGISWSVEVSF